MAVDWTTASLGTQGSAILLVALLNKDKETIFTRKHASQHTEHSFSRSKAYKPVIKFLMHHHGQSSKPVS